MQDAFLWERAAEYWVCVLLELFLRAAEKLRAILRNKFQFVI